MQNWHRHSSYSNIYVADSAISNEDYAKRAVEVGHKAISSVEHGWQGYYFQTYELAKKYNLKCVIGSEAYWVKDRLAQDKSNHHILLLAKSNMGREAINDILSEANISGYYYRPRVDIGLLLSLPPNDVLVTSACIAFSGYEDIDDIILQLHNHFRDNFLLEIQYHNTERQKIWNTHLQELSSRYRISMSVGLDSHYIKPEDAVVRDAMLEAKGTIYEDEADWYMDYPDDETIIQRFLTQGVFDIEQIKNAMAITDQCLEFCDYDTVKIFTKDIKLPTLYPGETKEQKNERYRKLITRKFKEYMKHVPANRYQEYYDGVKAEIKTYEDTGMVDYPLLDYAIVKDAVEHGCLVTDTGRGSAVGFFTNTLCGFSKVDRFTSAIKLYPERFISTTRILETHSLPDIDLNTGTPDILEASQVRVLGENHAVPMIAFGTLKKKSAFKIYAKAMGMEFTLANTISDQIGQYEKALKEADDDEKDEIDLFDFVSSEYRPYIEASENYWGVISDKKRAPSAYLLYQGDIRREIGLIKCKSESTKKEYITCVIDGAIAENYKFLKNDILKVDVVLLIDKVFKRIGIEHFDVNTLIKKVKTDKAVWDLYAKGYTIGVNQVEKDGSRKKCMRYKPSNISELSAFVAAIRPGFKSMYNRFERRENFSYGIKAIDNLIQTQEMPVSWILYQETLMSILNYAGFPMDQCYGIIKAIAKKHPEKVRPLKAKFIDGFIVRIMKDEGIANEQAAKYADEIWTVVNDNCGYGFNSAHAYSMALDSLYQAWQKVHYPYEFYEVLLQHYTDKGNKGKVVALKDEMKRAFGISEGHYKFRNDHRKFTADKDNKVIYPSLSSVKGIGDNVAEELYALRDCKANSFIELLVLLENTSINSSQLETLIKLNFFSEFGDVNTLLKINAMYVNVYNRKQFAKNKLEQLGVPEELCRKHCTKETAKTFTGVDTKALLEDMIKELDLGTSSLDLIRYEYECLGYVYTVDPSINKRTYLVTAVEQKKTIVNATLYEIWTGSTRTVKMWSSQYSKEPFTEGQFIKLYAIDKKNKREPSDKFDENGKRIWIAVPDSYEYWIKQYEVVDINK